MKELYNQAVDKLRAKQINSPELDARILLLSATNISLEDFYLKPDYRILENELEEFNQFILRRLDNEPVAKIIGKKSFWLDDFIVNEHTLDPRPDSEVIIEAALKLFPDKDKKYKFIDFGTGSGCLILSLLREFQNARAIGSDISMDALNVAKANAETLGFQDRINFIQQNWGDSLAEEFDLIISNPPYIPTLDILELERDVRQYDPIIALDGGVDGLDPYRYLAKQLISLLKKDAYAILEFGYGQSLYIKQIFKDAGYVFHEMLIDLAGIERAIIVRKNHEPRKIY